MCFTLRLCAWQFVIEWTPQVLSGVEACVNQNNSASQGPSSPSFTFCMILPKASLIFWMHVDSAIVYGTCAIKVVYGSHVRCFNNGNVSVYFIGSVISPSSDFACLRPPPLFTPSFLPSPSLSISHLHVHRFLMEHHNSCCTPMDGIHIEPLSSSNIWLNFDIKAYEDHISLELSLVNS